MERLELENWLIHHPGLVHSDLSVLLDECEKEARDHAHRDAWVQAQKIAERRLRRFESGFIGHPASDTFVTREVCHEIARELKLHEPSPDDYDNEAWLSQMLIESFDPEARTKFLRWLKDLVDAEEHAAWLEIVRFTDHSARSLIREEHMTDQCDWDLDHTYSMVAARVVRILIGKFQSHAASESAATSHGMNVH